MAMIDTAFHYYLSNYGSNGMSRYDTHKKSELRAVYNNMVKVNKESPLYLIHDAEEVCKFSIDLKEQARSVQNVISALSDNGDGIESVFGKRVAQSSDESSVSAEYIGSDADLDSSFQFDIEVESLASPQVNTGNLLVADREDIRPGSYRFELNTNIGAYEFQYNVAAGDTNLDIQEKLMRLINNSNVSIRASLISDGGEHNALCFTSKQTGLSDNEDYLFEILPAPDNDSIQAMRTLGIDQVTEEASNSSFTLDGQQHSSLTNSFTVNNLFELTLNGPSENGPVQIGFKADVDAVADNMQSLVDAYNNMLYLGQNYADANKSRRLLSDILDVTRHYSNDFEAIGLETDEDGTLSIDRSLLADSVTAADASDCFKLLNSFKDSLQQKAAMASIDPMQYVDKIMVAYKNPGHNFATPYISSIYSGMMVDWYC